ncbi:MAG: CHAT domain-containing tetratricopeptide repeat protein [Planctomycetota bacterium]
MRLLSRPQLASTPLVAILFCGAGQIAQAQQSPELHEGSVTAIAALVNEGESLIRIGDGSGAHAACQRAMALAMPHSDDNAWLGAADTVLDSLGKLAYRSGDMHCAHDVWVLVHAHRSRALGESHPNLQAVRINLATCKMLLGRLHEALSLQEQAVAILARTSPAGHPELLGARNNLAITKFKLGDLSGALAIQKEVLEIMSRTLPDDDPGLLRSRQNVALTLYAAGDIAGALLMQESILETQSKTLPHDHPALQSTRTNLASTKLAAGDLAAAYDLQAVVLRVRSRTMHDDHPDLQTARNNLAATMLRLGDIPGAMELQEQVLAVLRRSLPDNHHSLQVARQNMALTLLEVGDLPGATSLQEQVLEAYSKSLPNDHHDVQGARLNLANSRRKAGDLLGTLELEEAVLAAFLRTLPDNHPDLQSARHNLAGTKLLLGDVPGALALQETVLEVRSKSLPDDHPELQAARSNLASSKLLLGDLPGALALQDRVFTIRSLTLPDDHPDLQAARSNLAVTKEKLGDLQAAAQLYRAALIGARARIASSIVSTRTAAEMAISATGPLSHAGSVLDANAVAKEGGGLSSDMAMSLTIEALALHTATQSAQLHAIELLRQTRRAAPTRLNSLLMAIATTSKDVDDAIALPPEGHTDGQGRRIRRDDAVRAATLAKDAAERALLDTIPADQRSMPTAAELTASLAQKEAAVSFLMYTRTTNDAEKPWIETSERRFAAFVLAPSGTITWHSLCPVSDIESLIASIRRDAAAGGRIATRSTTATTDARPGVEPEGKSAESNSLNTRLAVLRDKLLAPVLAALPKDTKRVILSPADEMLLAPIEDLPLADGRTFGEAFDVQTVPSLRELIRKPKERAAEPRAFVVGGIDYDQAPAKQAPIVPEAATPILDPIATAPKPAGANPDGATRSGDKPTARHFAALPGTATEAEQLETLFAATYSTVTPTVLRKTDASEAAFTEQAPGKTFLHLATHGYFAPETYWKATDARDDSPLARFDVGRNDRTAQLSPFSLTGIALAGANLPPDELGRREGILTAQEITRLDLTACYLATLSACNTTLGVRRGGTGLASLRQAFHAAGARFVLATLWEVDDAEAQKLMTDFYTRLWKNGEEPRSALRAAKRAARERGAAFRDWAGWLITGR